MTSMGSEALNPDMDIAISPNLEKPRFLLASSDSLNTYVVYIHLCCRNLSIASSTPHAPAEHASAARGTAATPTWRRGQKP